MPTGKQVVARLMDGYLYKGFTEDFHPGRGQFTIKVTEGPWMGETVTVSLSKLKALFFVKSLKGNRDYRENKLLTPERLSGQRIIVSFVDGETIRGTATGINLGLLGFYLFPADAGSNNKRIFIVRSAVRGIKLEGQSGP